MPQHQIPVIKQLQVEIRDGKDEGREELGGKRRWMRKGVSGSSFGDLDSKGKRGNARDWTCPDC